MQLTGSSKKERPLSGGQLGNLGRAGKIFSREAQAAFLKKYRVLKNVDRAAKAVGFRGTTVFHQVHKSKRFAAEYEAVRQELVLALEDKLGNFAFGTEIPIHNGQTTAIFGMLRAFKPERWRENVRVGVSAEGDFAALLQGMAAALTDSATQKIEAQKNANALEHQKE